MSQVFDDYLNNALSEEQLREFELQLQDPDFAKEFLEYSMETAMLMNAVEKSVSGEQFKPKKKVKKQHRKPAKPKSLLFPLIKAAAAITICSLIILYIWKQEQINKDVASKDLTTISSTDQKRIVLFNNGAKIILNANSSISYKDENKVTLNKGTVTCEVPNSAKGFTVISGKAKFIDLGTVFSISKFEDSSKMQVSDGSVRAQIGKKSQILKTGQAVLVGENSIKETKYSPKVLIKDYPEVIKLNSKWKYYDKREAPSSQWFTSQFNDSTWQEGFAELGYGEKDERTVLSYGGKSRNKIIAYYFRKNFYYDSTAKGKLACYLRIDDGCIIYINGKEVKRFNMPQGEITHKTLSSARIDAKNKKQNFTIDKSYLKTGINTIAVRVHQHSKTSSDISFNFSMKIQE